MDKVYLVYGNTYFDGYGAYLNAFGVFSTLEEAEKVKKQKEDEYFERESTVIYSYVEDRSEVEFQIMEIEVDKVIDRQLGGYAE